MSVDPLIRAHLCVEHLKLSPKGHIAEFGILNGLTLNILAEEHKKICEGYKYYGFDCWQGIPFISKDVDGDLEVGECKGNKEKVLHIIKQKNLQNVVLVDGLIEETLPQINVEFSFCFLDLDIYWSTRTAVNWLAKGGLVKNGIIGFHDYNFHRTPGIIKAIKELNPKTWQLVKKGHDTIFYKKII